MINSISIRSRKDVSFKAIVGKAAMPIAVAATAAAFLAILAGIEIFAYICGTIALAAICATEQGKEAQI